MIRRRTDSRLLLRVAVACLALSPASAWAQAAAAAPGHSLKVTPEVVEQGYCAGAGGVDFLHLRLRLRYVNAGRSRLIVYRGGNLFFMVFVGSVGPASAASSYELKTTSARYATRDPEPLDTPRPGRDFETLAPGQGFSEEVSVTLPVTPEGAAARRPGTIGPGEHELCLRVSTWYESRPLGEKLRGRWSRAGRLWTEPVGTSPVRFDTRAHDKPGQRTSPCRQ